MKKFLIWASIFSLMIWFLFTGFAYLKPGSIQIVKATNGIDVLVNESKHGRWSFKWPLVPFIGWGEVLEEHEINEFLNFKSEFYFLGDDFRTYSLKGIVSGGANIKNWDKFIFLTDPKTFDPAFIDEKILTLPSKNPTRQEIANLFFSQQVLRQSRLPFWLAEISSRAELADYLIQENNIANPEDLRKLIQNEYPWIWALGRIHPILIMDPESAPSFALRYFQTFPAMKNNLQLADRYLLVKFRLSHINDSLQSQKIEQFLVEIGPEVREEANKLVEGFLQYLKNQEKTLIDFENPEDLDIAKENFLASLPSQPSFANTPNAFRFLVNREWMKVIKKKYEEELTKPEGGLQEALDKQVKPFFVNLPSSTDPVNVGLWQITFKMVFSEEQTPQQQLALVMKWVEQEGSKMALEAVESDVFEIKQGEID